MNEAKKESKFKKGLAEFIMSFKKNYVLYAFMVLPFLYFLLFKYVPMTGNIIAVRKYVTGGNYFGEQWSGFKYFKMFLTDNYFWTVFQNTIILSVMVLLITFPLPIIFSLLLNEIGNAKYKKVIQSITIIPKFLSIIVVVMIFNTVLSPSSGSFNVLLNNLGIESIYFMNSSFWFRPVYIFMDIWQFMGWNSIIYMAVLAGADPEQYEAAMMDGANRLQQTIHITLPVMLPTISINFIISVGNILNLGFEKVLLIYTPTTYDTSDIIQTYVYRMGLLNSNYSYATAVGLFQALIGLTLLYISNKVVNKLWDTGLW
ncbi:MAG: ABC transporter permease subunit [Lachnospiraceae bacterium]